MALLGQRTVRTVIKPGKVVDSRGRHRLVCVGWDYYDEEDARRPGDRGTPRVRRRLLGTYQSDYEARREWLRRIGEVG